MFALEAQYNRHKNVHVDISKAMPNMFLSLLNHVVDIDIVINDIIIIIDIIVNIIFIMSIIIVLL